MKRLDLPELLDEDDAPRADMERSLRDLRRFNRYLGGLRIYRSLMRRMLPTGARAAVADLGAGTGDQVDSLGANVLGVAVDVNIRHLLYLRERSRARRVVADARNLPFRDGAVDVVTSAHFFHHFTPEENEAILRESLRASRRGVIVNDTERHVIPYAFCVLIGVLRLVGRITRSDAPGSVRRGYTAAEAGEIAARAGASKVEVRSEFPFRFGVLLWKRST
jgi:ubiquinone/menaquinone biosynthesis C-methylase UbiE